MKKVNRKMKSLLQKCLLATLAVAVLCASLAPPANALPLSQAEPTARLQESDKSTDRSTGSAERVRRNADEAPNTSTSSNTTIDLVKTCMETCYGHIPQAAIERMRSLNSERFIEDSIIHPGLVLGIWLEDVHRQRFCSDWELNGSCEAAPSENRTQTTNDTVLLFRERVESTLSGYRVTFNESYYPRYTVHPPCSLVSSHTEIKHVEYINNAWNVADYSIKCTN